MTEPVIIWKTEENDDRRCLAGQSDQHTILAGLSNNYQKIHKPTKLQENPTKQE